MNLARAIFLVIGTGNAESITWISYTTTWGGFSANPTYTAKYALSGKFCVVVIECTSSGTSNSTSLTFTLPFKATNSAYTTPIQFTNGGTLSSTWGIAATAQDSTTVTCYRTPSGSPSWTSSGGKGINHVTLIYQITFSSPNDITTHGGDEITTQFGTQITANGS